jgi:hypothetical protein
MTLVTLHAHALSGLDHKLATLQLALLVLQCPPAGG